MRILRMPPASKNSYLPWQSACTTPGMVKPKRIDKSRTRLQVRKELLRHLSVSNLADIRGGWTAPSVVANHLEDDSQRPCQVSRS